MKNEKRSFLLRPIGSVHSQSERREGCRQIFRPYQPCCRFLGTREVNREILATANLSGFLFERLSETVSSPQLRGSVVMAESGFPNFRYSE